MIITAGIATHAFSQKFNILAGINYGGPLPTHMADSTSGKPLPGIKIGFATTINLSKHFFLQPEIYYSFEGVNYSQSYTKDTTVSVVIHGSLGTVPSFYTAYINGKMRFHFINMPLFVGYRIGKTSLLLGPYFSYLSKGKDAGDVRVVIGHGGFYNDYTDPFNNIGIINKFEGGIVAGANVCIYKKLSLEIKTSRSVVTFYKPGTLNKGPNTNNKFYNTFVNFSLSYCFYEKTKTE